MKEYQFLGSHKYILAALSTKINENNYEFDNANIKFFEFDDPKKFNAYINADFIYEIIEKCNADWLDDFEEQILYPNDLPTAIEIVSKAITQKKNVTFVDYLNQTKELMELALAKKTFFAFRF